MPLKLYPLIRPNYFKQDPIQSSVTVGDHEFQVIGIDSQESINTPFKILVKVLLPSDLHFEPKLPTKITLKYQCLTKREVTGILWSVKHIGYQAVHDEQSHRALWIFELRPAMYILSQDHRSDVYCGEAQQIIQSLVSQFQLEYICNKTTLKEILIRYDQNGIEFWNQMMSYWNLHYSFQNGKLHITENLTDSGKIHEIPFDLVSEHGSAQTSNVGQVAIEIQEREKELTEKLISQKISSSQTQFQKIGRFPQKKALDIKEQLTQHKEYTFTIHNNTHLNVGDKIKFTSNDYFPKEYFITNVHHKIYTPENGNKTCTPENTFQWHFISIITTITENKRTFFIPMKTSEHLHQAIVVGKEEDKVTVDEYGRVKIRYLWQKSEVDIPPIVTLLACGKDGRGTAFIPHAGDEVTISCIKGDLTQPVVVGSVSAPTKHPSLTPNNSSKNCPYSSAVKSLSQ